MMPREAKQDILDFVNFYVILGIVRIAVLCTYVGISERTIQRWNQNGIDDKRKGAPKQVVRKLSEEERDKIYCIACSEEYKDLNAHEVCNSLLDKGIYLASESSFYRILRERKALTHRSETKEGVSRKKPDELKVTGKNQVWMWDITWIKTSVQGLYYYAYVIEDLFDRSIVGWAIYENESDEHAKELFSSIIQKEQAYPNYIHSDNGNAMKGITLVAFYYRLGIIPSFSRPRVSDDNPYIESFFKTLKYKCTYPRFFTDLDHARKWFADFIDWYNKRHMHSGLQYVTPAQKRNGEHHSIFANRNDVIEAAKRKHPERWGNRETQKYMVNHQEVLNPTRKDVA
ncbi:MAG TPA: IS3 family transposase [Treponema sp.]|nr:IS3 family transposase [Treponema sp.]